MNPLTFYQKVVQHEVYGCQSGPTNNVYQLAKLTSFAATVIPRQQSLSRLVVLLAALQVVFNKRGSLKFISISGAKKICVFFQLSKLSQIVDLKDNFFNFTFCQQQRLVHAVFDNRCTFFFNIHALMFTTFLRYYRFVFNMPRLRFSLQVNLCSKALKAIVFASFLLLPSS